MSAANATARLSFALRSAVAVALTASFCALVLGLAWFFATLIWPGGGDRDPRRALQVAGALGLGALLWSIAPRRGKWKVARALLRPEDEPELFAEIDRIAAAAGQRRPARVYLVPDPNAFVFQERRWLAFPGPMVLGLGLPFAAALSVGELRGVLAHEFGHFRGGDTRLGPWIASTRAALERSIQTFGRAGIWHLAVPLQWYGKLFLRVTNAISRRQERAADEFAASYVGGPTLARALYRTQTAAAGYEGFLNSECEFPIEAGVLPPLGEGFARFLSAQCVHASLRREVERRLGAEQAGPYDTHPPARERIAAAERVSPARRRDAGGSGGAGGADRTPDADRSALTLFRKLPEHERALAREMIAVDPERERKAVPWEDVVEEVLVPYWMRQRDAARVALQGYDASGLVRLVEELERFGSAMQPTPPNVEQAQGQALNAAGSALCLALRERGFTAESPPGEPIVMRRGADRWVVFVELGRLVNGELTPDEWLARCRALGVADLSLLPAPRATSEAEPTARAA